MLVTEIIKVNNTSIFLNKKRSLSVSIIKNILIIKSESSGLC